MGMVNKFRRLLGLVEGYEDEVAKQVGERTKVSEEEAKKGVEKATDAVRDGSGSGLGDRSSYRPLMVVMVQEPRRAVDRGKSTARSSRWTTHNDPPHTRTMSESHAPSLDGHVFKSVTNAESGDVSGSTHF